MEIDSIYYHISATFRHIYYLHVITNTMFDISDKSCHCLSEQSSATQRQYPIRNNV